ncbi:MAG: UvrD-helicase domain-containing protein [Chloroflexota bacterium]|nr:UvrD-helicase domain-containing protein [Chloroflexota bacterium]
MESTLADLNSQQRRAILHQGGPLLILAGPGSGKTRVITRRIAHRVATGQLVPQRILALTFTNRAAREMRERVQSLLGTDTHIAIGTFHWAMHAVLRRHGSRLGYPREFRLLADSEARRALRRSMGASAGRYRVADVAAAIAALKNGSSTAREARRFNLASGALDAFSAAYERELRSMGALDLDDLLYRASFLLREDPEVRERCRALYDEILVDEYQDTNPVQRQILRSLLPETGSLIAVGDEDQAIYGWRQADATTLPRFADDFPGASLIKLEETYRSSKTILRAAGHLIAHNTQRIGKTLRTPNAAGERPVCFVAGDEVEEADWIATEIGRDRSRRGRAWTEYAVLYRVNVQSRAVEDALLRHGIPYRVHAGHRFYERAEIRRAMGYLRLALDERDDDAARYLLEQVPGIGEKRLEMLRLRATETGSTLADVLNDESLPMLPAPVARRVVALGEAIGLMRANRAARLPTVLDLAIGLVHADLEDLSPMGREETRENLDELRTIAAEYAAQRGTLRGFLDRLPPVEEGDGKPAEGVHLMTLHAAKGLEYPVVFLPGLEEGLLPHRRSLDTDAALEEERRLCYVGMTRAQKSLFLSYAHGRLLAGQAWIGHVSRFLGEMGAGNITLQISDQAAARPRLTMVQVGERVFHQRWDAGTVEFVEGAGRDTMVTIAFDSGMRQRIQLCHAPLSRIVEEATHVLAG